MQVVDYSRCLHSDWAKQYANKLVLLKGGLKHRPGIGKRRRCQCFTAFKNTNVFQTKLARRLAIYEEMKLKAMTSHVEVVSQHIEKTTDQPNDVLIFKPSETDTKTGDLLIRQPKVRDVLVQSVVTDIEERAQRVWHKLTTKE